MAWVSFPASPAVCQSLLSFQRSTDRQRELQLRQDPLPSPPIVLCREQCKPLASSLPRCWQQKRAESALDVDPDRQTDYEAGAHCGRILSWTSRLKLLGGRGPGSCWANLPAPVSGMPLRQHSLPMAMSGSERGRAQKAVQWPVATYLPQRPLGASALDEYGQATPELAPWNQLRLSSWILRNPAPVREQEDDRMVCVGVHRLWGAAAGGGSRVLSCQHSLVVPDPWNGIRQRCSQHLVQEPGGCPPRLY